MSDEKKPTDRERKTQKQESEFEAWVLSHPVIKHKLVGGSEEDVENTKKMLRLFRELGRDDVHYSYQEWAVAFRKLHDSIVDDSEDRGKSLSPLAEKIHKSVKVDNLFRDVVADLTGMDRELPELRAVAETFTVKVFNEIL